jgi:hypothetical protein
MVNHLLCALREVFLDKLSQRVISLKNSIHLYLMALLLGVYVLSRGRPRQGHIGASPTP